MTIRDKMCSELLGQGLFERAKGYALEYAAGAIDRNVFPTDGAIADMAVFDEPLPDGAGDAVSIIDMLHRYGSPATVSQIGGRYFGLVNGGIIPTALAAKWLSDFWDQNTPLYASSPIASKIECVVEDWLRSLFGLPADTAAGFVSGSSMAILCGLAAARFRIYERLGWDVNSRGLVDAPKIRIVAGAHIHGAVLRAVALLGFGKDTIEWVDVDVQGRIVPELIPQLDERSILILQAGNVNSGSFDLFHKICDGAQGAGAWVHIDGAFGLWAAGSEELRYLTSGIEKADSWSVDGHKTLNTPYDSGVVLCKDRGALISALHATGAYLLYGDKRDGMLYTPEMSRRARAVELWAAMKYLGKQGIDELVLGLHERARQFAEGLSAHGFRILNDVVFNQVLVACDDDVETEATLTHIQELRDCWCGGSEWFGLKVIRISVCSWATTEKDVEVSVGSFVKAREMARMG